MKIKRILPFILIIAGLMLLFISYALMEYTSEQDVEEVVNPVLEAYLNAYNKYKDMEFPIDYYEYMKNIKHVRVKWLRPEVFPNTVKLKWEELDPYILDYHKITNIHISIIDLETGKIMVKTRIDPKYNNFAFKSNFLKIGAKYKFIIRASNDYENTAADEFIYAYNGYTDRIPKEEKHLILTKFYYLLDDFKLKYIEESEKMYSIEELIEYLKKWIEKWKKSEKFVKDIKIMPDYRGVFIVYTDNSTVYVNIIEILMEIVLILKVEDEENIYSGPTYAYDYDTAMSAISDNNVDLDFDVVEYIPEPVLPGSDKAIVLHGLGINEIGDEYPKEIIEQSIIDAGFIDLTIVENDEDALDQLKNLDDGQYGFIYCNHHGGIVEIDGEEHFAIGMSPYYNEELEQLMNIGTGIATNRIEGEIKYYRYFTDVFIDTYCNDVPFPRTFIYWFSCGTAMDHPSVYRLLLSFINKGLICGWVGMERERALIAHNNPATRTFFSTLRNKPYLIDAVKNANSSHGADLKLLPEDVSAFNRASYIDHEFVDLGIRWIEQAPNRNLRVIIGNEGTLNPQVDTEFNVGVKDIWAGPEEEYVQTANAVILDGLQRGETFSVEIPPTEASSWIVGLDINNDIPDDTIRSNNTRLAYNSDFLPDLVISSCERMDEESVQVRIENIGLQVVQLVDEEEFYIDIRFPQGEQRIGTIYPDWALISGGFYSIEINVPRAINAIELTVDSTNLIEEFDEDNTFRFNL